MKHRNSVWGDSLWTVSAEAKTTVWQALMENVSPAALKSFLHRVRHCCVDGDTSQPSTRPSCREMLFINWIVWSIINYPSTKDFNTLSCMAWYVRVIHVASWSFFISTGGCNQTELFIDVLIKKAQCMWPHFFIFHLSAVTVLTVLILFATFHFV